MLNTWLADVKKWAAHPYNENGNLMDWFLFIGLMGVCTVLWSRIIRRLV